MILNDSELAVLELQTQNIGIFFRLDTTPVVRLWVGFGSIAPGVNVFDTTGAQYDGFGEIQNVPAFKQLVNGTAERVEFSLSGVSGNVLTIASGGDAQQVKGKRVSVGFAVMDSSWALLGPIKFCANYTADFLSIAQSSASDLSIVRTVTLSCGSLLTARRRPSLSYFSNQDQLARSTGDRFCERTPVYANGFNKTWPVFPA
jgi:hypothetical protein